MSRKILLADDSVTIQKVIELTFMDEDYEVKAVSNGDEAVAALPALRPDFVIADVHMPGANGYEVCRRSKEMRPDVPVLLLVGTFEPFDEGQARAAGADSFLKKPFDSQELLQRVQELLAPAATPAAAAELPPLEVAPPPPLDLGPAPFQPAGAEPDWGAFQLEPEPQPHPQPAAPAPPSPQPFPPPAAAPPRAASPFLEEDSPFVLEDDHAVSYEVEESVVLPEGEPMFELEHPIEPIAEPFGDTAQALGDIDFAELPSAPLRPAAGFGAPWIGELAPRESAPLADDHGAAAAPQEAAAPPPIAPSPAPEPLLSPSPAVEPPPAAPAPAARATGSYAAPAPAARATGSYAAPAAAARATGSYAAPVPPNGGGPLSDEDVERIARRVVELIGDKPVRDVVWEVVPDLAETVIRDRLRELESQIENPAE